MQRTDIDPRWQDLSVIERLVREARTVAVVGLSPDPGRPSHGVARYLRRSGLRILPVNPNLTSWEGLPAYASLADLPAQVDIVDVFRRPEHVPAIARDAVAIGAGALWLQLRRAQRRRRATIAAEGGSRRGDGPVPRGRAPGGRRLVVRPFTVCPAVTYGPVTWGTCLPRR